MDQEVEHAAKQREASRAGFMVAVMMILMAGIAVIAAINLLPLFKAVPSSTPEVIVQE